MITIARVYVHFSPVLHKFIWIHGIWYHILTNWDEETWQLGEISSSLLLLGFQEELEESNSHGLVMAWSLHISIGWLKGKNYRKLPYFMGKSMVSCQFSLKSTHWSYHIRLKTETSPQNLIRRKVILPIYVDLSLRYSQVCDIPTTSWCMIIYIYIYRYDWYNRHLPSGYFAYGKYASFLEDLWWFTYHQPAGFPPRFTGKRCALGSLRIAHDLEQLLQASHLLVRTGPTGTRSAGHGRS